MENLLLKCACGKVQGVASGLSPTTGTRLSCCCLDCQSFARHLERDDVVLDEYGGTDIVQIPVSSVALISGQEEVSCLRLSAKGLYRWYTGCCRTPIGNTLGPGVPFVGLIHNFIKNTDDADELIGKNRGYIQRKDAAKPVPAELHGNDLMLTLRALRKIAVWKVRGLSQPSVFFGKDGVPVSKPQVL